MAASSQQLTEAQKEEREVLDFLLNHGAISGFEHCAGTSNDWESHVDAYIVRRNGARVSVDLKTSKSYGFILEHENRFLGSTGSAHGKQEFFLIHNLDRRRFALVRRDEVLRLGIERGGMPPDRMTMQRVSDSVRRQPYWVYTGNELTNTRTGGKKRCYDVVQKIPYTALSDLPSWRKIQL